MRNKSWNLCTRGAGVIISLSLNLLFRLAYKQKRPFDITLVSNRLSLRLRSYCIVFQAFDLRSVNIRWRITFNILIFFSWLLIFRNMSNVVMDDLMWHRILIMKFQMSTCDSGDASFISYFNEYQHWTFPKHSPNRFVSLNELIPAINSQ